MTCEPMDVDMSANLTFAIDTFPHRTRLVLALRYRGPPLANPADGTVWGSRPTLSLAPRREICDLFDLKNRLLQVRRTLCALAYMPSLPPRRSRLDWRQRPEADLARCAAHSAEAV